jgi:hypothetical protein
MRTGISARQKSLRELTELLHCEDFNGGRFPVRRSEARTRGAWFVRAELRRYVLVIEYTP